MIAPESNYPSYDTTKTIVTEVAKNNSFDTFVHFQRLAEFAREVGVAAEDWPTLLSEWDYDSSSFLESNGRGNCVDFAAGSQSALRAHSIESVILGKKPDNSFTGAQKKSMRFRHTSLVTILDDKPVMFEPGWKLTQGVPLLPVHEQVDTGTWKFTTIDYSEHGFTQETVSPLGKPGYRSFEFNAVASSDLAAITKGLLRVPRRMEMLTRLDDNVPHGIISYNPHTDILKSTLDEMGDEPFTPDSIREDTNRSVSEYYGFDVKEELLGCFALYKSLPESFWVR